jgi:hypothetical protein
MPRNSSSEKIAALELSILRALCALPNGRRRWIDESRKLSRYQWQEPDHKVVYDALRQVRTRDPKTWREQLAAQVTRMGFPDFDWENYFKFEGKHSVKMVRFITELAALTVQKK